MGEREKVRVKERIRERTRDFELSAQSISSPVSAKRPSRLERIRDWGLRAPIQA